MLSKLLSFFASSILGVVYEAIFAEFERRGEITWEEDLTDNDRN